MSRNSFRAPSWKALIEALFIDSWRPDIGRFRSNRAFRGMTRADGSLATGLSRLADVSLEAHLIRNFRKYAPRASVPRDSVWNWLALAQHYGLPTRLLDWTYSPLVALHFVTDAMEDFDVDGVVWCVDFVRTNQHLPKRLKDSLAEEGSNVFTTEMIERAAPALADLAPLAQEPFLFFLEPPSLDDRIVNQFALFSVLSRADARLDDWVARRPGLCRRIVIPAELKLEIRDKLDQANVTERVLFPGLDGMSRWLARQYSAIGDRAVGRRRARRPNPAYGVLTDSPPPERARRRGPRAHRALKR
jgi:hypothetical protein